MKFKKNNCLLCETETKTKDIYPQNLSSDKDDIDYSGRKVPDNLHYKMIRCIDCELLFAEEIYDSETIVNLYKKSNFDYLDQIPSLEKSYSYLFKYIEDYKISKNSFLDIGCANGFLLKKAKEYGFRSVYGSELSNEAIINADKTIKKNILQGKFDESNYKENYFDVIFFAMILEHFENPNKFLKAVYKILKPGGLLIGVTHNEKHFLVKMLRNKHPIINDEHVSIFNKVNLIKIMKKNYFKVLNLKNLKNYYTVSYWQRMIPMNKYFRKIILFFLKILKLDNKIIGVKAGNIYIICQK